MIRRRLASFSHAFRGCIVLLRGQPNARIHVLAATGVVALGLFLKVSAMEWALLSLTIGFVVSAEAANSAIEALCDRVCPTDDPLIRNAKDLAAAAVFLAAIAAVAVAAAIFVPRLG